MFVFLSVVVVVVVVVVEALMLVLEPVQVQWQYVYILPFENLESVKSKHKEAYYSTLLCMPLQPMYVCLCHVCELLRFFCPYILLWNPNDHMASLYGTVENLGHLTC